MNGFARFAEWRRMVFRSYNFKKQNKAEFDMGRIIDTIMDSLQNRLCYINRNKEKKMKVKENIYSVGVLNPNLRIFDIIMKTDFGTTYSSYLVKAEKAALVEAVHLSYFDAFLENVQEIMDINDIDYLILNHTEPDHSGSVKKLLEINPNIEIYGTASAIKNLKSICNCDFKAHIIKDGEVLDLGGKTMKFIPSPNLHWPDSMFTYIEEDKLVFTCDFLGCHYCEPRWMDTAVVYKDKYEQAFKYYYDAIFSPFKPFVLAGLDKLSKLSFDTVCPSHGPILTERISWAMDLYRKLSTEEKSEKKTAVVAYVSAYGCTRALANTAKKVMEEKGYLVNIYDIIECDNEELLKNLHSADAILIGSPTINRDALKPVWDIISLLDAINIKGKQCALFGSYGWSGEAVPMLKNRLLDLKLKVKDDGFKACFVPSDDEILAFKDYLKDFAE